jgi:hypothetical protein
MSLLIRRDGESNWQAPKVDTFGKEAELQDIIVRRPSLLPGVKDGSAIALKEVFVSG